MTFLLRLIYLWRGDVQFERLICFTVFFGVCAMVEFVVAATADASAANPILHVPHRLISLLYAPYFRAAVSSSAGKT